MGTKLQCALCKDIIWSKHRHDFVVCSCKEIFVDGGNDYLRYGANNMNNVIILEEEQVN